jgi:hypothetical protein
MEISEVLMYLGSRMATLAEERLCWSIFEIIENPLAGLQ